MNNDCEKLIALSAIQSDVRLAVAPLDGVVDFVPGLQVNLGHPAQLPATLRCALFESFYAADSTTLSESMG
jgi:hypothetical protein